MSSKARWILFPSIKVDFVWCADVTRGLLSGFEAMGCNCVTSGKICLFAFQFAAADRSMVHSLAAGLPWRQETPNRFPDPLKWRFLNENYSFSVKSSEKIHVFMYITANMCPKAQIVNIFRVRSKMANFAGASTLIWFLFYRFYHHHRQTLLFYFGEDRCSLARGSPISSYK